jgi:hypothetical protein
MQTVLLQGVPIETTDAGAAAVVRLQAELVGAEAKVAVKDDEIDAIKRRHATELAAVVAHSLDVEELDEAVASRIALIGAARSILGADFDPTGKPDMVIRRFAAEQKLGEAKLADKDDAYVTIVFDTMAATIGNTNLAQTPTSPAVQPNDAIKAYNAQNAIQHKRDDRVGGHADIQRAIRLSFGWVQRTIQDQHEKQSHI